MKTLDKDKIIKILSENNLSSIEEIPYNDKTIVLRFFYEFDEDEIEAAKAYSNDESEDEENGDEWYEEFFLPYLNDLAVDNIGEIIEDIMDKLNIDSQFVSYEMDEEEYSSSEFIAAFSEKEKLKEIEDILEDLEL
ncbi:hypothetical protein [Candidatus Clostridium stratigraminis]|uniref:Uncharacterized protein n=1 Tax=Candidatus Clostridium stratigraminis TaxID=3381661 RepID=A0ABW8T6A8_9CLOT